MNRFIGVEFTSWMRESTELVSILIPSLVPRAYLSEVDPLRTARFREEPITPLGRRGLAQTHRSHCSKGDGEVVEYGKNHNSP